MTDALQCTVRAELGRFSLDVEFTSEHRVTGVFGPSGAGKSSLLECIIGHRRAARGTIRFGDQTWLDSARGTFVAPERRDIGYVPQSGLLFPHLSARENIASGRRRADAHGPNFTKTFDAAVSVLELGAVLDQSVSVLSGGERQRVSLARALCSGPRLLVLDEPLASLDAALQRKLLPFLRRIREEFDVPMVLVSHSPLELQALADHVIAIREGRIIASGDPASVLSDRAVLVDDSEGQLRTVWMVNVVDPDRGATSEDGRTVVRLGDSHVRLVVRGAPPTAARSLLVGIPAEAVMIATQAPTGLSAANTVAATITQIQRRDDDVLIRLHVADGHASLMAALTRDSTSRLGLAVGDAVFAVVKASSCEIVSGARGDASGGR